MTTTALLHIGVIEDEPGSAVLTVHGDVDVATADTLRSAVLDAFARYDVLVLDLSGAMFFDSYALRVLDALRIEAVRSGRPVPMLRGVRPLLAKMLKVTGLDAVFLPHGVRSGKPAAAPLLPAAA